MKPEFYMKLKRERSLESEDNALRGINKKIKMSGSAIASGTSHEAKSQFAAYADSVEDRTRVVTTLHSARTTDISDSDQPRREDKISRAEEHSSGPKVDSSAHAKSKPNADHEIQAAKPKPKRKSKSKKAAAPPPPPATKIGDAFFEPGCPAIGCFLPAKTKGTRRPEKKDMIWRCHWEGCDKINWSLYRLNRHIKEKHTQNKFWICQKEGQAYSSKEEFEEHQKDTGHVNTEMGR